MSQYELCQFIDQHHREHDIKQLREILSIPRSTYYQSKHQTESKWKRENQQLLERIKKIYFESSRRYGAIKVHRQLIKEGKIVGIFPSGTRSSENSELKAGAVTIAQLAKSQIVPAAYIGPKNAKGVFKRQKGFLIYGKPFTVEGGKEGREASVHFLEEELTRLTKQLREMHPEVK